MRDETESKHGLNELVFGRKFRRRVGDLDLANRKFVTRRSTSEAANTLVFQ